MCLFSQEPFICRLFFDSPHMYLDKQTEQITKLGHCSNEWLFLK